MKISFLGGGGVPVTNFADTGLSVVAPYLGPNWFCMLTAVTDTESGPNFDSQMNAGTGFQFGNGGGAINNGIRAVMIPAFVDQNAVLAGSQTRGLFTQLQFVSRAVGGANAVGGIIVMASPNQEVGYGLQLQSSDGGTLIGINRWNGSFAAGTIMTGAGVTYIANDVLRIEAIPNSGLTSVTLNLFKNGILQSTTTDATGSRLTSGLYGMIHQGAALNSQVVFKNFSGGLI